MDEKQVLLFAPSRAAWDDLWASFTRQTWLSCVCHADTCRWSGRGLSVSATIVGSASDALERIRGGYYSLVIVDCRHLPGDAEGAPAQERAVRDFLRELQGERDRERRYPFDRVVVLVGDADEERVDELLFEMGQRHVGACLRDMSLGAERVRARRERARERFVEALWARMQSVLAGRKRGKRAICAAGGGITGVYYELGVLKCMHDSLVRFDIRDFDLYFGISAGAIICGLLTNGYSIDEIIAHFGGIQQNSAFDLSLGVRHLNVSELPGRIARTARGVGGYARRVVRREDRLSLSGVAAEAGELVGAFFRSDAFEERLAALLEAPGRTNDFRQLKRQLYIGATDQDRRVHVLFGDRSWDHVPISRAIQASTAIHPFIDSVEIEGRWYTDGWVTRTNHLSSAIEKGADLIFAIDPFLPLISEEPGFNAKHGSLWVVLQDFKTVAFTRYENETEQILRQNPGVSCYTFVPGNRMRRLMTHNALDTGNFGAIAGEAYQSTYRRLRALEYKMAGELDSHGMVLDLSRTADRAARLAAQARPVASALID